MWLLVALCLLLGQSAAQKAQKLGKKGQWSYDFSLKHVSKGWGETCLHGERQSPIALPAESKLKEWKSNIPKINWNNGRRVNIIGKATGKTLRFKGVDSDLGKTTLGKDEYTLKYFDLHMKSEHTIGGKQSDLEIQFVHTNSGADHTKLIVSILCDRSEDEDMPTMNVFMNRVVGVKDGTKTDACPGDDFGKPMELDLHTSTIGRFEKAKVDKLFYKYIGSETTPPCKEKVKWIVMGAKCRLKNQKIFDWLKKQDSLQKNFRPIQEANGRVLWVGPTNDKKDEYKWPSKGGDEDSSTKPNQSDVEETKKEADKDKAEEEGEKKSKETDSEKGEKKGSSKANRDAEDNESKRKADNGEKKSEAAKDDEKSKDEGEKKSEDVKDSENSKDEGEKKSEGAKDSEKSKVEGEKKSEGAKEDEGDKDTSKEGNGKKSTDKDTSGDSKDSSKSDGEKEDGSKTEKLKSQKKSTDDNELEKKPEDDDDDTKPKGDKKPSSHAAATLHTYTINSHLVKPILGFSLGLSVLLTLLCIFQKRANSNEYLDSLLEHEV